MRNIGFGIQAPQGAQSTDSNDPFVSSLPVRGTIQKGVVVSISGTNSATVRIERQAYVAKYRRYQKKISKIHVHNPPSINAKVGDTVQFIGCRPISKTKSSVIVKIE